VHLRPKSVQDLAFADMYKTKENLPKGKLLDSRDTARLVANKSPLKGKYMPKPKEEKKEINFL
jgi:hypothetical protein